MLKPILFSCCLFCFAFTSKAATIIEATLITNPATSYRIIANQSALNDYEGQLLNEGKTNEKGELKAIFEIGTEQPVTLFIGKQFLKIWIIPNTSLQIIEVAGNHFQFKGEAAAHNIFFYQSGIMMPFTIPPAPSTQSFDPQLFFKYQDSLQQTRNDQYDELFSKNPPSKTFASFCKAEISHAAISAKSQYPLEYIYMKKTLEFSNIPAGYFRFWSDFRLYNDSCLSDAYQNSIHNYLQYIVSVQMNNDISDTEKFHSLLFKAADSLLTNHPFTLQKQKTDILLTMVRYFDLPVLFDTEYKKYQSVFPESVSLPLIETEWKKKTGSELSTPSFRLKNTSGQYVDIKDLRGKVVYIDFWGSWCKACLLQMPNSAKVQEKLKNEAVVFLFIDFFDSKEKWLKCIRERKLGGLHIKAEKADEAYFDEVFGINQGFPRYALLDRDGRLITTAAPHPNDDQLENFIRKYLD